MTKYYPFIKYLEQLSEKEKRFDFSEIEEILDFTLPKSAYSYNAWWGNSPVSKNNTHTWAAAWVEAGWRSKNLNLIQKTVIFEKVGSLFQPNSQEAIEGYLIDKKILSRARDQKLVSQRKELDDYTCQVCGFKLQHGKNYVIEVHHLKPLSISGQTSTSLDDLVSLCPTCHRIAHLRQTPLDLSEITELLERKTT